MTNPDREELVKLADDLRSKLNQIPLAGPNSLLRKIETALRRLASSEDAVKVRELEWTVEKRYGYDVHVGRATGLMYEAAIKACSPGWVVTYGGETIFNSDEANEDAAKAAAQSDYEARIRSALIAAPPADAGMREAVQQALDEAAHIASLHTHHALWHGLLPYGWDAATEQFGRNLAGAIAEAIKVELPKRLPALTAPGATLSKRQMLECILLSLNVDGVYLNSLTVGELRRAL